MKVLFSNPPWWSEENGQITRFGVRAGSRWPFTSPIYSTPDNYCFGEYIPYPFFMGYATTYAKKQPGADIHFRDSIALRESYKTYFNHLEEGKYNLIFIEIASPSWEHDQWLIREIHRQYPETKIAVTGPITSTKSEEILSDYPVSACIRGSYEKGSVKVINGEEGIIDYDLLDEDEMNAAPFPYFDETYAYRYWDSRPKGQKAPQAQIWSSRGCPYKCIFCVWPATMTGVDPDGKRRRNVTHYSPEYIEAFIGELTGRFNQYQCIYFDDDTFNLGNKHVLDMCEVMKRVGLPWSAMCRADTIKMETWQAMKESGCFGVKLGFESGNQYVVNKIVNKNLDLEYASQVVFELKRLGMTVHGTFTYGLPGETKAQMWDTRRFIASLPFDTYQESGTAEIEGTPLHTLRQQGKLDEYEGAQIDADYQLERDGEKKRDNMTARMREN